MRKYLTIETKTMAGNVLETPILILEYKKAGGMQDEAACQLAFALDAILMQRKAIGVKLDGTINTAVFGATIELDYNVFHFYALCWTGEETVRITFSVLCFL